MYFLLDDGDTLYGIGSGIVELNQFNHVSEWIAKSAVNPGRALLRRRIDHFDAFGSQICDRIYQIVRVQSWNDLRLKRIVHDDRLIDLVQQQRQHVMLQSDQILGIFFGNVKAKLVAIKIPCLIHVRDENRNYADTVHVIIPQMLFISLSYCIRDLNRQILLLCCIFLFLLEKKQRQVNDNGRIDRKRFPEENGHVQYGIFRHFDRGRVFPP